MDLNAVDVDKHEQISEQGLYPAFFVEKIWVKGFITWQNEPAD